MMLNKVTLAANALTVFRQGEEVANPALWKNSQLAVTAIATLIAGLLNLASSFGYSLSISDTDVNTLSTAIVYIVGAYNIIVTLISSRKVGFPAKAAAAPALPEPEPAPLAVVEPPPSPAAPLPPATPGEPMMLVTVNGDDEPNPNAHQ